MVGIGISMIVGKALYGAEVGVATGLDRFDCRNGQTMVTKQRGCKGLMQFKCYRHALTWPSQDIEQLKTVPKLTQVGL